jgi:type I restriction enzyme S subunit
MNEAMQTLNDACEFIVDCLHTTAPSESEGFPLIRTPNIGRGRLVLDEVHRVSHETYGVRTRRAVPEAGDLILAREAPAGNVAVVKAGEVVCLGQRTVHLRPNRSKVDPDFLCYFLLATPQQSRLLAGETGATAGHVNLKDIRALPLHGLPILTVQEKAGRILSAYDDLIENNRRRMVLLDDAARQLYREWFVRLRFPGYEHARIVDGVPEGWERTTIDDLVAQGLAELQTGPFGTQLSASEYTESGTPVINVRNIGFGDLRTEKLEFVSGEVTERLSRHVLLSGDIVFGRKGAVERHLLVTPLANGFMQGSDCIRLRLSTSRISSPLLSFAFREEPHKNWMLTQCSNKATMASLNQDVIGRISVVIPSRAILQEFDEVAHRILLLIDTLMAQNQKLRAARDLLLPRLMSGEIAV